MGDQAAFSVSVITPATVSAGAAAAVIRAGTGPGGRPRVRRITVVVHGSATSSSVVEVYRAPLTNLGTPTGGTSVLGQGANAADASATNIDTVWSAPPTLPSGAVRLNGVTLGGAIGNGAVIAPAAAIELEPTTGLILWCPSASAQLRITPEWSE